MVERVIQSNLASPRAYETGEFNNQSVLIERFRQSRVKIAIQKDGELTDISRLIYSERFGIEVEPIETGSRTLVSVSDDGEFGFLYARNKDICNLVAAGAVDQAIVGIDRLIEDEDIDLVEVADEFREYGMWSLVLATPIDSETVSIDQIRRVATKYPVITKAYLESLKIQNTEIISVTGGSEIYPYLDYRNGNIDAIVDLKVTGASLRENSLIDWDPPIGEVFPVLIRKKTEPRINVA